ncbi:CsgE family curli-type amyloid fiber assembly protein [Ferrimonas futtsuensis]|uniref:CsgE family curli-type amyloid fiber assembly protein n=1 Tax=Ferrimonas futtsuensis TaxID=364764 RepID=UPI000405F098
MRLLILMLLMAMPLPSPGEDIELDGMLFDRTLTRFGKEFIYYYAGYWRNLPGTQGFIVTVYETG